MNDYAFTMVYESAQLKSDELKHFFKKWLTIKY